MAAVEELPEELMTLILLKLPVKSLLRFKCVKKSWYSLIKSPQFVHLHPSSSSSSSTGSINYDSFIVRRFHLDRDVLSLCSYETLDDLGNEINTPISNYRTWLCGSCDGLVCISNYKDQIIIWNPTIREFRSLFVPPTLGNSSDYYIDSVAFGSDPNTGQYKVVVIGVPCDDDGYGDCEARLYDFSTDSWKETAIVIPGPFRRSRHAISLNGAFHWSPCDDSILTFHISNEVTQFITLPDFVVGYVCYQKQLCVSSKSQLTLILHEYGLGGRFEICVMTEYGVKESWTRLFKIEHLPNNLQPIPFWDEQRLLFRTAQGQLACIDLQHQNLCHFPIGGDFDLCPYSQSLVSVNGIGKSII